MPVLAHHNLMTNHDAVENFSFGIRIQQELLTTTKPLLHKPARFFSRAASSFADQDGAAGDAVDNNVAAGESSTVGAQAGDGTTGDAASPTPAPFFIDPVDGKRTSMELKQFPDKIPSVISPLDNVRIKQVFNVLGNKAITSAEEATTNENTSGWPKNFWKKFNQLVLSNVWNDFKAACQAGKLDKKGKNNTPLGWAPRIEEKKMQMAEGCEVIYQSLKNRIGKAKDLVVGKQDYFAVPGDPVEEFNTPGGGGAEDEPPVSFSIDPSEDEGARTSEVEQAGRGPFYYPVLQGPNQFHKLCMPGGGDKSWLVNLERTCNAYHKERQAELQAEEPAPEDVFRNPELASADASPAAVAEKEAKKEEFRKSMAKIHDAGGGQVEKPLASSSSGTAIRSIDGRGGWPPIQLPDFNVKKLLQKSDFSLEDLEKKGLQIRCIPLEKWDPSVPNKMNTIVEPLVTESTSTSFKVPDGSVREFLEL
ncbi:unnamed protein product [Amoebophrya sp. A120]|nr:unnamed protein product [Amoebophrya sp. A120]|eukprot:GSA120T00022336001.1